MKLIIDIDEKLKQKIDEGFTNQVITNKLWDATKNGTPLEQEPCDDAVSRQAVLEQTYLWSKDEFLRVTNPFDYLRKRINSLPLVKQEPKTEKVIKMRDATPEERESIDKYIKSISKPTVVNFWNLEQKPKTGHWEDSSNGWMCSECKTDYMTDTKYCPNCSTKMESEVRNEQNRRNK